MKHRLLIILIAFSLATPAIAFGDGKYPQFLTEDIEALRRGRPSTQENKEALPKWLDLFKNGNLWEKQIALDSLLFLEYSEYRKDTSVFDPILKGLKDKDPAVRTATAAYFKDLGKYSNGCCKETNIVPSLIDTLQDENPETRREAAKALAYFKDKRAVDPLLTRLQDKDPWVRLEAVFALGEIRDQITVLPLLALLFDDSDFRNKFVQQECLIAIRKIGSPHTITHSPDGSYKEIGLLEEDLISQITPVLINKFNDPYLKTEIIKTFGKLKIKDAKDMLNDALKDPNERIRKLALEALLKISPAKTGKAGKDNPSIDLLITSLKDPSTDVRESSVFALGENGDERAIDPLIEALHDSDKDVQIKAINALGKFKQERILDELIPFFGSGNFGEAPKNAFLSIAKKTAQQGRFYYFRKEGDLYVTQKSYEVPEGVSYSEHIIHPHAVDLLIHALDKADTMDITGILVLIWDFHSEDFAPSLIKLLNNNSPLVRRLAITRLYGFSGRKALPYIINALNDTDPQVREKTIEMIGAFQDKQALEPLLKRLNDPEANVRKAAARALGEIKEIKSIDPLIEMLSDENNNVRKAALQSLGEFDEPRIYDLNIKMLEDKSPDIRREAVRYNKMA